MSTQDIHDRQAAYFQQHGKYEKFSYEGMEVHEYVSPLGAGYVIYSYRDNNGVSQKKAESYGPEDRSYDWADIEELS